MVAKRRLVAQQLVAQRFTEPHAVVQWMGALQAQEYLACKWAVALRLAARVTDDDVERAITSGAVLRTHLFRGTWQLVAPEDLRWMLALIAPKAVAGAKRRHDELKLDESTFHKSAAALAKAFAQHGPGEMERAELGRVLRGAGIDTEGQRLMHLLWRAELDGLLVGGGKRGNETTYALLDERAPRERTKRSRAESLAELARRYFQSRGPATTDDFTWWTGLTSAEARAAVASIEDELDVDDAGQRTLRAAPSSSRVTKRAHLLPAFDEYLVGYRARAGVLADEHVKLVNAGGGLLGPVAVVDGAVVGTWKRERSKKAVAVAITPFAKIAPAARALLEESAENYGAFLGLPATVAWLTRG